MKRINLTAAFTIQGIKFSTLENTNNQGSYRQLAIDPNKTITDTLAEANLASNTATLRELINALASAPTLVEDLPV